MAAYATLKRLGMTDSEHRKQFFGVQNQRCVVCTEQLVYGHASICDKVTKTFFCRACARAIACIRKVRPDLRDKLLLWAEGQVT